MNMIKNYREIFGNINTEPYTIAAERFLPDKIEVLFIFESTPFPSLIDPISGDKNLDWSYFHKYKSKGNDFLRNKISDNHFDEKILRAKAFLEKFAMNKDL